MRNSVRIGIVVAISLSFFFIEIFIAFRTKSLALIADSFHYLNDIVAYIIAFIAAWLQEKGSNTSNYTYAFHRAELVGAFFNGVFLLALALSILLQSIERFINLEEVHDPILVLIVGAIGLGLNALSIIALHDHGHGHGHSHGNNTPAVDNTPAVVPPDSVHASHNHVLSPPAQYSGRNLGVVGVLVHIFGDAVNNVGVIVAALILWKLDSPSRFYADPAVSLAISLIIFASAIPMTRKSGRILLEASPVHLDLENIKRDISSLPDVLSVHDLHVWHLSQAVILASLHVCVPEGTTIEQWETTEQYLQHCFAEYGINHVTVSPEIYRDNSQTQTLANGSEEGANPFVGKCRIPSQDDGFGCAVMELKKRPTHHHTHA